MPPEKVKNCLSRMSGKLSRTVLRRGKGSNPFSLVDYCSHAYQNLLQEHGFICSMSRKGECQDNACAETFFHSMKVEWIYGEPLKSRYMMKKEVREYIEVFYNRQRLHSNNGYLWPGDFERVNKSSFFLSAYA